MSYEFCSKIFENRLRFDKVTESLKVGTFLRHSVVRPLLAYKHPLLSRRPNYLFSVHMYSVGMQITTMCLKQTTLMLHTITSTYINRFW